MNQTIMDDDFIDQHLMEQTMNQNMDQNFMDDQLIQKIIQESIVQNMNQNNNDYKGPLRRDGTPDKRTKEWIGWNKNKQLIDMENKRIQNVMDKCKVDEYVSRQLLSQADNHVGHAIDMFFQNKSYWETFMSKHVNDPKESKEEHGEPKKKKTFDALTVERLVQDSEYQTSLQEDIKKQTMVFDELSPRSLRAARLKFYQKPPS
jgi:hypothetical protein